MSTPNPVSPNPVSPDSVTPTSAGAEAAAGDPQAILGRLQHAYDVVKRNESKPIALGDHLVDDLNLDSLDVIDLVTVLEDDFPPEVIERVVDASAEIATVGELVDAFAAAA